MIHHCITCFKSNRTCKCNPPQYIGQKNIEQWKGFVNTDILLTHTQHINHLRRQHKLAANIKKQWIHSNHLQLPTVAQEYDCNTNNDLINDCTGDGGGVLKKQ